MKKLSLALVLIMLFAFLVSCSPQKKYENFEEFNSGSVLKRGEITYIFFDALPNTSIKGEQIGVIDGDKTHKVYSVKGYSSDEWVIEYYDVIMSTYSLYKSDAVTEIPEELQPRQPH